LRRRPAILGPQTRRAGLGVGMIADPARRTSPAGAEFAVDALEQVCHVRGLAAHLPQHRRAVVVGLLLEGTRIGRLRDDARQDRGHLADLRDVAGEDRKRRREQRGLVDALQAVGVIDMAHLVRENAFDFLIVAHQLPQRIGHHDRSVGQREGVGTKPSATAEHEPVRPDAAACMRGDGAEQGRRLVLIGLAEPRRPERESVQRPQRLLRHRVRDARQCLKRQPLRRDGDGARDEQIAGRQRDDQRECRHRPGPFEPVGQLAAPAPAQLPQQSVRAVIVGRLEPRAVRQIEAADQRGEPRRHLDSPCGQLGQHRAVLVLDAQDAACGRNG
jgi:hypothetical protein